MLRWRHVVIFASTLLTHWVLWLAYTNNVGIREIIAGVAAAGISTVAVSLFAIQGKLRFAFRSRDLFQAIYLPGYALEGTWEILQALCKQLFTSKGAASFTGAVRYDVGGDDPLSAGRALAVTYTTLTPNFIVLGIAHDQKLMIYHQIIRGKILTMTRNLGARP